MAPWIRKSAGRWPAGAVSIRMVDVEGIMNSSMRRKLTGMMMTMIDHAGATRKKRTRVMTRMMTVTTIRTTIRVMKKKSTNSREADTRKKKIRIMAGLAARVAKAAGPIPSAGEHMARISAAAATPVGDAAVAPVGTVAVTSTGVGDASTTMIVVTQGGRDVVPAAAGESTSRAMHKGISPAEVPLTDRIRFTHPEAIHPAAVLPEAIHRVVIRRRAIRADNLPAGRDAAVMEVDRPGDRLLKTPAARGFLLHNFMAYVKLYFCTTLTSPLRSCTIALTLSKLSSWICRRTLSIRSLSLTLAERIFLWLRRPSE